MTKYLAKYLCPYCGSKLVLDYEHSILLFFICKECQQKSKVHYHWCLNIEEELWEIAVGYGSVEGTKWVKANKIPINNPIFIFR
jgi:predicted amidophosphoribosyltransferase